MELQFMQSGAKFSPGRKYRYYLYRIWDDSLPRLNSIGLNPSTASEYENDPTIRREISFAKSWGYGSLWKYNLYALVSSDPKELNRSADPIGNNDRYLLNLEGDVVICWGSWKLEGIKERADYARSILKQPFYCLGKNQDGEPKHPLYLPKGTNMEMWR